MKENFMGNQEEYYGDNNSLETIESLTGNYENKSEEEIYLEIIRINEEIEKEMSYEEYEALFEQLKNIRPLLTDQQNIKLDHLLKQLKKD